MVSHRQERRGRYATNPYVVLSDVTIVVVLILLFYFTARTLLLQKRIGYLEGIALVSEAEQARAKRREEFQARVASVLKERSLQPYVASGQIDVRADGDSQVFVFGSEVLFESNEYQLKPRGQKVLGLFNRELAAKIQQNLSEGALYPEILVQGHTDTQKADNWGLSVNRALAVVRYFEQMRHQGPGVRPEYLSAMGFSCHRPWKPPAVGQSQPRNRRIEVRVVYAEKWLAGKPFGCDCDR